VTSFRAKVAAVTDVRIRLYDALEKYPAFHFLFLIDVCSFRMSEIITAIKLVKLYNWEKSFADQVLT